MVIDVFTLFPEWFGWFCQQRHVKNALRAGHDLRCFNYRDTTPLSHGQVDDEPYGGGGGAAAPGGGGGGVVARGAGGAGPGGASPAPAPGGIPAAGGAA